MSGSTLFETYETELIHSINVIKGLIEELQKSTNFSQLMNEIETEFDIAEDSIEQMQLVAKSTFGGQLLIAKVNNFRAQIEKLKAEKDTKTKKKSSTNSQLRGKLIQGNQTIDKTGHRVKESIQISLQSEKIGEETLQILDENREQLENSILTLDNTNNRLDTVKCILRGMTFRIITNKLILWFMILVLLVSILSVFYFKWLFPFIHHGSTPTPPQTVNPPPFIPTPQPQPQPPQPQPVPAPF